MEGPDGYLYGVTTSGGYPENGRGIAYKISKSGQFQKLHDFCQTDCSDGETPVGNLIVGADGNLYGVINWAGKGSAAGVIYKISPAGAFTILTPFSSATGGSPNGGLVLASDGNFYGATPVSVYRVTPGGALTPIYLFQGGPNGTKDGEGGTGALIQASDGNLYGVTFPRAVYRISLGGLYQQIFVLDQAVEGVDVTGLIQASDGNLWGTTSNTGGANLGGAVYTITTGGTLLQSTFVPSAVGLGPAAPLIQASDGKLYDTAYEGGRLPNGFTASGSVFVVDAGLSALGPPPPPPPPPAVSENGKEVGDRTAEDKVPETTCSPGAGAPIDIAAGNVFYAVADCVTAGQNVLRFTRFYNSRPFEDNFAASLGSNWRSTFDRYLRFVSSSVIETERADGQVFTFTLNGGSWSPDTDVDLKLTQTGPATWTVTNPEDSVESYTAISATEAILMSVTARNGYTQTLVYGTGNQLQSVTDSYSRSLNFTYQNGLLNTLTTPGIEIVPLNCSSSHRVLRR